MKLSKMFIFVKNVTLRNMKCKLDEMEQFDA